MIDYDLQIPPGLPDHERVLCAILNYFSVMEGVSGAFLSGSTASGEMDADSDLDVGILFYSSAERETCWAKRWDWDIAPWFHRFDADHIKPYFVIYLYEPDIKADINLYTPEDLPTFTGSPYRVLWDKVGVLDYFIGSLGVPEGLGPDWENVVHEDERFWAWTFYCYSHVHRGEYYHVAYEFPVLRDILEQWTARLAGYPGFNSRRIDQEPRFAILLQHDIFPKPERSSLKLALLQSISFQRILREKVETFFLAKGRDLRWNTSDDAIVKITGLVESL